MATKKTSYPKYLLGADGDYLEGTDLNDLKQTINDAYGSDVDAGEPWDLPVYKLVGVVRIEQPEANLKITLPKGA